MAATASIQISGTIIDAPTGRHTIGPIVLSSADANSQVQRVVLQAGNNGITVPATPAVNGCIIKLPATNTSVTTLKGDNGDTGVALGKTTTQLLNFDPTAPPTAIILHSVATQTGLVTEIAFF